jgi:hypothetical protein
MDEVWVFIQNAETFGKRFLIGFIKNRNISENTISFNARCVLSVTLDTFEPALYTSREQFIVSKNDKVGYIGPRFTIGFFDTMVIE